MTMKTKSIIFTVLGTVILGFSSCSEMLDTSSTMVMFEQDHQISEATDTVYSVLGIIQKLQTIADRTVLLGEIRGDLTSLNNEASKDLKEISNFEFSSENKYNNPLDYYAVINNCNYYLAHADTTYMRSKEHIFLGEYGVVLAYRAWAYLRLAEAYGKVPFFTEPLTNGAKADPNLYEKKDIKEIARLLIDDLKPFVDVPLPDYGQISDFDNSQLFFIPIRLILGELCLWAGDGYYIEAAKYFHDYLSHLQKYVTTGYQSIWWNSYLFASYQDNYSPLFGSNSETQQITFIPMEGEEYNGVTSELPDIFNSTEKNLYYYTATASQAIRELSANQTCVYYDGYEDQVYYVDPEEMTSIYEKGDLRLGSIVDIDNDIKDEKLASVYNTSKQTIKKINATKICIFRKDLVYLRFAEALNYAGFPESAFAVLKYGLSNQWYTMRDDYISGYEQRIVKAKNLNILDFPYYGTNQGFYPYVFLSSLGAVSTASNTMGIHSRGCGLSEKNDMYALICHPDTLSDRYLSMTAEAQVAYLDSVRAEQMLEVEQKIVDELALETVFEGNRFGDLVRFSMHRGERMGQYSDNAFLAGKVAARNGSESVDKGLESKLTGDGKSFNPAWYMSLPE